MRWTFTAGDILDVRADVLVCSANIYLNLSGGVGGAILLRCGDAMQKELHEILARGGRHYAKQGEVIVTGPHCLAFKAVVHAVAVDAFYKSSPEIIAAVVANSLIAADDLGACRVALTALATGFGRLQMGDFAQGIKPILSRSFGGIEEVVVCVKNVSDSSALAAVLDGPR